MTGGPITAEFWRQSMVPAADTPEIPAPTPPEELLARTESRITPTSNDAALAACIFDLRRGLIEALLERTLPEGEENATTEDELRDALPPLKVPPGPFVPVFSAWRSALAAVLGLLAGSAVAQGLRLSGGWDVLGGMGGVAAALWGTEALARAAARGSLPLFKGLSARVLRRRLGIIFGILLLLALLRDFLQGNPAPEYLLAAVGDFLSQGMTLGLFTNMYTLLVMVALFGVAAVRPVRLDAEEYRQRLRISALTWWEGAARYVETFSRLHGTRRDGERRRLRQVGQDLYSFACELPPARRAWLEDRLRRLGLEAPRAEGELIWDASLAQSYDPVGYLETGDRCYVDLPPLLENGELLRKGTVRKVRT